MSCITTRNETNNRCNCGSSITTQMIKETVRAEMLLAEIKLREEIIASLGAIDSTVSIINTRTSEIDTKIDALLIKP